MSPITEQEAEDLTSLKLTDEGTRYKHYSDLLSVFEVGAELIKERINSNKSRNRLLDLDNMFMFAVAAKALRSHIDVLSGFTDTTQQYKLSKTLMQIEQDAKVWKAERAEG